MLVTERERLATEIAGLADQHGRERAALMPILQAVQARHHVVSDFAMQCIGDALGVSPVEVQSVVSFYSFLSTEPKGRYVVRLCRTISCLMEEAGAVARQLENDLGIEFGETTRDGLFTLEWTNCLGMCDQGPAMMVNERMYTRVRPEMVSAIVDECRKGFVAAAKQEAHA